MFFVESILSMVGRVNVIEVTEAEYDRLYHDVVTGKVFMPPKYIPALAAKFKIYNTRMIINNRY